MRKSRNLLIITAAIGLLLSLLGITYAYLRIKKEQENTNEVALLKCLGIDFTDETSAISLNNAYPVSDEEGMITPSYTFKITNKCSTSVYAKVNMETLTSTNSIDISHIKIWVNNKSTNEEKNGLLSNSIFPSVVPTLANATQSNNLTEINLKAKESVSFELRLWVDEETTWEEGGNKTYAGKIVVTISPNANSPKGDLTLYTYVNGELADEFPKTDNYNTNMICKSYASNSSDINGTTKWNGKNWLVNIVSLDTGNTICSVYFSEKNSSEIAAPNGWYEAEEGTLLAGIRNNNPVEEPLTTPGVEISTNDEAVLASAADDYGTSYYFRGNVQNNFVSFANMCWRIVRITGDGSIKLVLYNYSSASCTQTGDDLAFAKYSGDTYKTQFNSNHNDNTYIGFMYGTAGSSTYHATHANINKSTILTNLEIWYTNNIVTYSDNLADIIWCNDKSTSSGTGIGTAVTDYGAYARHSNPSLICPNDNDKGKLSKFTVSDITNGNGNLDYKIGLLTLDELEYAGLKLWCGDGCSNTLNYLKENVSSETLWWTLTPFGYTTSNFSAVIRSQGNGDTDYNAVGNLRALRPSIGLKSTTTISSGIGTSSSPFVIS